MFGQTWYHGTLRKYVIYFGTLFDNIWINRQNQSGEVVNSFKIPLNYGPRDKFLARLEQNPNLDRPIAVTLPRMSFEMTNLYYDAQRKLNTLGRLSGPSPQFSDKKIYQYNPVPYNMRFQLSIMVKNADDGTRIIEQILPYFAPDFTATLNLNPDLGLKYDIPIMLDDISYDDQYEGSFEQRRALIWNLNFTMKGYLFGPTKGLQNYGDGGTGGNWGGVNTNGPITGGEVITQVEASVYPPQTSIDAAINNNDVAVETITVKPGQTPEGEATNNPEESVDRNEVNSSEPYGFIIDFTSNV